MTGLIPFSDASGRPYSGGVNRYYISGSYATAVYIGDPVVMEGTNTETNGNYASINVATVAANNLTIGPVVSIQVVSDESSTAPDLERKHSPASTEHYAWVADDPGLVFVVGEDEAGAAIVTGDIGNLGILVTGSGGSTVTGRSSHVLDSSSFDSGTANGQYLLLGKVNRANYSLGGDGQLFRVKINGAQHQLQTPGTSV